MLNRVIIAISMLFIASCSSPHSPMSFRSGTMTPPAEAVGKTYPAHTNKVWVTKEDLPKGVKYEVITKVDGASKWYGGEEKAFGVLAKLARKAGADAVIRVSSWHQPSGFAWSAPHATGTAIKLLEPEKFDITTLSGAAY